MNPSPERGLWWAGLAALALVAPAWQVSRSPAWAATPAGEAAAWNARLAQARQVDVNRASGAELERLPGVGPTLAARIMAWRDAHGPFAGPEALEQVPGIGPALTSQLALYLAFESGLPARPE